MKQQTKVSLANRLKIASLALNSSYNISIKQRLFNLFRT